MKFRAWRMVLLALALLTLTTGITAHGGEPFDVMKSAVARALAILLDPKLNSAEKNKERIERLKEVINPLFDYDEMARRTLAAHWRRRQRRNSKNSSSCFARF